MNDLSWFLYLAGVAPNIAGTLGFFAIILGIASIPAIGFRIAAGFNCDLEDQRDVQILRLSKRLGFIVPILCVLLAVVSALIPSKETFYLIAASEIGEQVVKDPRVQGVTNKSFQAIEAFLDEQITKAEKEKAKAEAAATATNEVAE
jgi:hypothetical protein